MMNKRKFLTALAAIPAVAALAACGANGTTIDWATVTGDVTLVLNELQAIEVQAVSIDPKLLSNAQKDQITAAFSTITSLMTQLGSSAPTSLNLSNLQSIESAVNSVLQIFATVLTAATPFFPALGAIVTALQVVVALLPAIDAVINMIAGKIVPPPLVPALLKPKVAMSPEVARAKLAAKHH